MNALCQYLSPASLIHPRVMTLTSAFGHAPFFFWLCEQLQPRTTVELGSAHGYSFFVFCQAMEAFYPQGECVAVDTWQGDINTGAYSEKVFESVRSHLARHFPHARARLLRRTFDEAAHEFPDGSLDLVFVDGCHTYDAVSHDYETWLPKMSGRGIMLFHDTQVRAEHFGVWKFWEKIERAHPSFEFQHDFGLGVLCVGREAPESLLKLCSEPPASASTIRELYAALGNRLTLEWEMQRMAQERDRAREDFRAQQESWSWRITAPLRHIHRMLGGR